jgi:hypothetical protein
LPRARIGAVLVPEEVAATLASMLRMLATIEMPAADRLSPAVGLDSASLVRIGRPEDRIATFGSISITAPERLYVWPEDTVAFDDVTKWCDDIAEELTARLVTALRRETR